MAEWMTGVMMTYMIGLEYFMGIVDVESVGREKVGSCISNVSQEAASAGVVERTNPIVKTGATIVRSTSSSGAGGGGCYPV